MQHRRRYTLYRSLCWVVVMRAHFYTVLGCAFFAGCAFFPDFAHTPAARLPVAEVVNQIRCDMYEFLKDHESGTAAFSLDLDSYATVELSLSTSSGGDVKFARIDSIRLGAQNWLAKAPFPTLGAGASGEVSAKVTVNIAQNPELLKPLCENGRRYGYAEILSNKPYADRVLINDMRIASWLKRTFESSERIVPSGAYCNSKSSKGPSGPSQSLCSVGLDNATLTTKFQIVGDVSGGILALERLIPVVQTPTVGLDIGYTHQIKIIFQGNDVVESRKPRYVATRRAPAPPVYRDFRKKLDCEDLKGPARDNCFKERGRESSQQPLPTSDASGVERQLRSIRDALILNSK